MGSSTPELSSSSAEDFKVIEAMVTFTDATESTGASEIEKDTRGFVDGVGVGLDVGVGVGVGVGVTVDDPDPPPHATSKQLKIPV